MAIVLVLKPGSARFEAEPVAKQSQRLVRPFLDRMFALLPAGAQVADDSSKGAVMNWTVRFDGDDHLLLGRMVLWCASVLGGLEAAGIVWGGGGS